ncbi:alpha/beta fold hydrolase [Variovorax sp. OV329]|uniref:alpha/beta fold hydrolase n=1 Tax=Variovorax sp. OV329 TaxID=1882825 RepID=UPI0008E9D45A|nr:alpha/beta hydrolase [Variovorax sp. OV329]SFM45767.1 Pimeloyl-ACP methyl ester carboxylesterase [Variovorax sp. OV329]
MTGPSLRFVTCADADGGHRMAYWQWGEDDAPHVVLCVHGLTRQGRDFDVLAQALLARAKGHLRVVCPDVVGRGQSDWLRNPQGYQLPTYAADMLALLAQLHAQREIVTLDYVGTSMGGLIGMAIAGSPKLPLPSPIRRLVLNDVGPAISQSAVERIGAYVGKGGRHDSLEAAADAMWLLSTSFGAHTREEWLELSRHMVVPAAQRSEDGSAKAASGETGGPVMLHYDPAIGAPIRAITPEAATQAEAVMWGLYDAISARTLLLRGAQSDLLTGQTAQAMTQRGAKARLVEFEEVGHAPTLVSPAQHGVVVDFLLD